MAAFRRRTVFAAPLILSLASGCKDKPERTNNPPPPDVSPSAPRFAREWDVRRVGPGVCEAEAVVSCAPGKSCNPPPPQASECPPGTSGKTLIRVGTMTGERCVVAPKGCTHDGCATVAAPCPLPFGTKLPERFVEVWVVEKNKNGDGGCHAEEPEGTCPPGVDCNPPTPRKVACPPGVTDTEEKRVALLADKTCAIAPDGCNAPSCIGATTPCP
jgi:hypothetical protein